MVDSGVVACACCMSAALSGYLGARTAFACVGESKRRQVVKQSVSSRDALIGLQVTGLARVVLSMAIRESSLPQKPMANSVRAVFQAGSGGFTERAKMAGLSRRVSVWGLCQARLLACVVAAAVLGVIGRIGSVHLAIVGAAIGVLVGWFAVPWALAQESLARKRALERHLSEAIEVICLGLRSGLSFDYALQLYCDCFESVLAGELKLALREWQAGLRSREEVLRSVAATYDSTVFSRVVDNIVRAMRFGSPLAESLEVLAVEARQSHKAYVEEKVMKAPVKMMLPVGTLILPSMLILVLGPVLLDLMQGF
ncbi:MAG: type II secretion system F family protein [Eggerthellaceae bacterium]|nr:type II secretion system F family protein [Eggerthellaceae bacterium]